jgi:hypothetical protein
MAYSIRLPDGTLVDNIPDEVTPEAAKAKIQQMRPDLMGMPEAKPAPFSLADTGLAALQGLTGAAKGVASAFGADNVVAETLGKAQTKLGESISPERRAEMQRRARLEEQAAKSGSTMEEISAFLGGVKEAPIQAIAQGVGSSIPAVAAGLATVVAGAPAAIAGAVTIGARALFGALQGAGEVKGSIMDTVERKLIEQGADPEVARKQAIAAQEYLGKNTGTILAGSGLGAAAAGTGAENILSKALLKQPTKEAAEGIIKRGLKEAGKEALPEGAQGGQEQYAQNVALTREGMATPAMQGVLGSAVRDAAVGALTGAAVSPIGRAAPQPEPAAPPPAAEPPAAAPLPGTYAGLVKELETLRQQEQTEDVKQRMALIADTMKDMDVAGIEEERAAAEAAKADEEKAKRSAFAAETPQQVQLRDVAAAPAPTGPELDLFGNPVERPEPVEEEAPVTAKELEAAGQARLPLRRTAEGEPTTSGQPEKTITAEDIALTGIPLPSGARQWVEKNVWGQTPTQLEALVKRQPDLIKGGGARAQLLRVLTAPEVPAFKEAQNARTETPTPTPTEPAAQPGGSQPSLAVPSKPARAEPVEPGAGVSQAAAESVTPDGLGLVPAKQPAGQGRTGKKQKPNPLTAATPFAGLLQGTEAKPDLQEEEAPKPAPAAIPSPYNWRGAPSELGAVLQKEVDESKRRSVGAREGQSLASLQSEVQAAPGKLGNALRRMVQSGKVVLEEKHPSGQKIGGLFDGKKVTLYADGVPAGESMAVALHEVGAHMGLQKLLGDNQYNAVIDRILAMASEPQNSPQRALAQRALNRIPKEDQARGEDVARDEAVAYFIEELAKAESSGELPKIGPLRNLWNQVKTAIVASINKALGTNFGVADFTPQQIAYLAESAMIRESKTGVEEAATPAQRKSVATGTDSAFQRWFGDSKVVDENGKPLVVYHGTKMHDDYASEEGQAFEQFGGFPNWFAAEPYTAHGYSGATGTVYPVYLSIQNPLRLTQFDANDDASAAFAAAKKLGVDTSQFRPYDDKAFHVVNSAPFIEAAQKAGYDGIEINEGGYKTFAAFDPTQIKSATGNAGSYDKTSPDIRFSVSASTEALVDSMGPLDPERKSALKALITGAKTQADPDLTTKFRTQAADSAATIEWRLADKFNGAVRDALGKLNPMGLFRQAQDYSKMLLEYFNQGAIKKEAATGMWKVDAIKNGDAPAEIYNKLNAWGEKNGYSFDRAMQIASRILEGVRLNEMRKSNQTQGTEFVLHMTDAQINQLVAEYNADPDLKAISDAMDRPRKALVDHMVAVGRLSAEEGQAWKDVIGYVPFDRVEDFSTKFSKIKKVHGKGISQLGKLPELVGSKDRAVGNVFDNYLNTLGWMIGQIIKNDAAVQTLRTLEDQGHAKFLHHTPQGKDNTASAYVDGEQVYWELPSKYDVMAFKDLTPPKAGYLRLLGEASNILRTTVTALPPFALKQVTDDIQRAIMTSGVKSPLSLVRMALTNFPKLALAELRGIRHPIVQNAEAMGWSGAFDFVQGKPAASLLADMGYKPRGWFKEALHRLEGITRASDLAVRQAIYDQSVKETGDALLAQTRAREFINFRRRGASDAVGALVTTIPFFNAYVQGMDVLYRAASGVNSSASIDRAQARKMFWSRAAIVTALATLYAMGKDDEDEQYKEADLRTRDGNWFVGGMKLPVPGELGAIFKVIPERVVEYQKRLGTPEEQEAAEAVRTALTYMFEQYVGRVVPIPQAAKPLLEAWTNYSFLTGRELLGTHQKQMVPSMQRSENTSELAIRISEFARDVVGVDKISPILVDNALRGYFGSTAAITTMVTDSLLNPTRVDRPLHKWALLSNYMIDPVGTRRIGEFYEEREKVGKLNATLQELAKTDVNAAAAFAEKHAQELAINSTINATLEQLEQTRAYRKFLNSPDGANAMPKDEREKQLEEIRKYEAGIVSWLREAKTAIRKGG